MLLNSLGQQISTYLLTLWICEILNTKIILLFFGFLDQNEIVILALFETIKKNHLFIENSAVSVVRLSMAWTKKTNLF